MTFRSFMAEYPHRCDYATDEEYEDAVLAYEDAEYDRAEAAIESYYEDKYNL